MVRNDLSVGSVAYRAGYRAAHSVVDSLVELVLPTRCVHCRRPEGIWCASCRPPPTAQFTPRANAPPISAAASYDGAMRAALIAYKERGQRRLAHDLGGYLCAALDLLSPGLSAEPILVPVPSRRSAARQRGGDHVLRLAIAAAGRSGCLVQPVLQLSGSVRDSAGLSAAQRTANISNRMAARTGATDAGHPVLLVDDILTTGATIREGFRALTAAGWQVHGAAVVAATARRYPAEIRDRFDWADQGNRASVAMTYQR